MDRRSRSRSRSRSPSPRSGGGRQNHPRDGGFGDRAGFRGRGGGGGGGRHNLNNEHHGFRNGGDHRSGGDRHNSHDRREKDRERKERERRDRMARMRADNEAEERGDLTTTSTTKEGGETQNNADGGVAKGQYVSLPGSNEGKKKGSGDGDDEEGDEDEDQMMQMMGFGGFGTTKGKAVVDNQTSAARGAASKNKGRKYRQYMNRKGGFNRPLDKMN